MTFPIYGKITKCSKPPTSILQGGAPLVIIWFINPINYRYITHSYWSYQTNLAI